MKAFRYRIYPTVKQEKLLSQTLETCRHLYNDALDSRIQCYKQGKSISAFDLMKVLAGQHNQYQEQVHSQVLQDTLKRLDKTYQNFFRRVKEKQSGKRIKVGFPRFKNKDRYHSFTYPQSGFRLTNDCKRIQLSKIGDIKLKYSRSVEGKIKTCTILRDVDQWFVVLTCENEILKFKNNKPGVGVVVTPLYFRNYRTKTLKECFDEDCKREQNVKDEFMKIHPHDKIIRMKFAKRNR